MRLDHNQEFENNNNVRIFALLPLGLGFAFTLGGLGFLSGAIGLTISGVAFKSWEVTVVSIPILVVGSLMLLFGVLMLTIGIGTWKSTSKFINDHEPEYSKYFRRYSTS